MVTMRLALTGATLAISLLGARAAGAGWSAGANSQAAGLPALGHVFVIVLENHEYGQVLGNRGDAPFLNQLADQGAVATDYHAIRHPSLPNYLALLGGDIFGIDRDCVDCVVDAVSLVDTLEAHGKSWKSYQEDLPAPCFLGAEADGYVLRHDPFLYFKDVRENPARCGRVVPLPQLDADLAAGTVPDFAWITPNLRHDMHDGSVAEADRWLADFVPRILASDAWRADGLLVITWDEGASDAGCCRLAAGGRVPALFVGPQVRRGYRSAAPASHYNLLRTIEDGWGLDRLGHSGDADVQPLGDVFEEPPAPVTVVSGQSRAAGNAAPRQGDAGF